MNHLEEIEKHEKVDSQRPRCTLEVSWEHLEMLIAKENRGSRVDLLTLWTPSLAMTQSAVPDLLLAPGQRRREYPTPSNNIRRAFGPRAC